MNVVPSLSARTVPEPPRERLTFLRRLGNLLLGKAVTIILAALAIGVAIATFMMLARGTPYGVRADIGFVPVLANLSMLLLLGAVLAGRITQVWVERRRGSAGSRLHVRLVVLFSVVAVAPAIVVAIFATAFFHFGIQAWFNDPVRDALDKSLQASRGYLEEHQNNIRSVALEMANDLARVGRVLTVDPGAFAEILATQTALRGLTEAVIYEPVTGQVMASAGLLAGLGAEPPPAWATERARTGDVAVVPGADHTRVRAVVQLELDPAADADDRPPDRPADPGPHDADRGGGHGVRAPRPEPLLAAGRVRLDLRARRRARAVGGGADRAVHGQPDRPPHRHADPRGRAGAERRSRGARAGDHDRGRDRRPLARLQPHDRASSARSGRS